MLDELVKQSLGALEQLANDTGVDLRDSGRELAELAAARQEYLATVVGQPGFAGAVAAEARALRVRAAMAVVDNADAIDDRFEVGAGVLLRFGAQLAAGLAVSNT